MIDRLAKFMVVRRWPLLIACLTVTTVVFPISMRAKSDRSVRSLFRPDNPRLIDYQRVVDDFGGEAICLAAYTDPNLLTAEGMAGLANFRGELAAVPGVLNASSLEEQPRPGDKSWVASFGTKLLGLGSLTGRTSSPTKNATRPWQTLADWFAKPGIDASALTNDILGCELYTDNLIGRDGQTAAVVVVVDREVMGSGAFDQTLERLRNICSNHSPPASIVGTPVMINDVYAYLDEDAMILTRISVLTMLVVIFVLFRNVRWVLIPLAIVESTQIWTRTLMVLSGAQLSIIGSMTTAFITVIGFATTIHIAVRYREEFGVDGDAKAALERALAKVMGAIFWTCLATGCGFGALATSNVAPVRAFGLLMAAASVFVGIAAFLLVPGGVLIGRFRNAPNATLGESTLADGLGETVRFIGAHSYLSSFLPLAMFVVAALGLLRIEVETDFTKNFRSDSSILRGYRFVESRLGGAGIVEVSFAAPAELTPEFLVRVRSVAAELRKIEGVIKVTGLTDFLDFFDMPIGGKRLLDLKLSAMRSMQPTVVRRFWNADRNRMLLQLRVREQQTVGGKTKLIDGIESTVKSTFGNDVHVTGLFVLLVYLIGNLHGDQLVSFAISVLGIWLVTSMAFRSWRLGMVAILPDIFSIAIVIGAMGWIGLKVNVATAMIGSISMGQDVAFSIHYLTRFRQELLAGASFDEALFRTHRSTGKALVFANLALMLGFSVLVLSQFVPTIQFGMLISVAILGGLLGNLVILPVLLRLVFSGRPSPVSHGLQQSTVTLEGE